MQTRTALAADGTVVGVGAVYIEPRSEAPELARIGSKPVPAPADVSRSFGHPHDRANDRMADVPQVSHQPPTPPGEADQLAPGIDGKTAKAGNAESVSQPWWWGKETLLAKQTVSTAIREIGARSIVQRISRHVAVQP